MVKPDINAFFETIRQHTEQTDRGGGGGGNDSNTNHQSDLLLHYNSDHANMADQLMEHLKMEADTVLKTQKHEKKIRKKQKIKQRITITKNIVPTLSLNLTSNDNNKNKNTNMENETNDGTNDGTNTTNNANKNNKETMIQQQGESGEKEDSGKSKDKKDGGITEQTQTQTQTQQQQQQQQQVVTPGGMTTAGMDNNTTNNSQNNDKPRINFTKKPDNVMEQFQKLKKEMTREVLILSYFVACVMCVVVLCVCVCVCVRVVLHVFSAMLFKKQNFKKTKKNTHIVCRKK